MAARSRFRVIPDARQSPRLQGQAWERKAESFLRSRGLKTVKRNFNCRGGEIDLVMRDGECLVFVEVRFRASARHGGGAETVGAIKKSRLIRAASFFLVLEPKRADAPCRFDVVSIGLEAGRPRYDWIQNAFDAE